MENTDNQQVEMTPEDKVIQMVEKRLEKLPEQFKDQYDLIKQTTIDFELKRLDTDSIEIEPGFRLFASLSNERQLLETYIEYKYRQKVLKQSLKQYRKGEKIK
jgi:hypothetical protein